MHCAFFAACGVLSLTTPAFAANPTVRLVVQQPLVGTTGAVTTSLDRTLPASQEFDIEVVAPGTSNDLVSATLYVWPAAEGKCSDGPPAALRGSDDGSDVRQGYRLAMTAFGLGDQRVLRATVPPLQIGQAFCFQVRPRVGLSPSLMKQVSNALASKLLAEFERRTEKSSALYGVDLCAPSGSRDQVIAYLLRGLLDSPFGDDKGRMRAAASQIAIPSAACQALQESDEKVASLHDKIEAETKSLADKTVNFTISAPVDKTIYVYDTPNKTYVALTPQFVDTVTDKGTLDAIIAQLERLSSTWITQRGRSSEVIARLKNLRDALGSATEKKARTEASTSVKQMLAMPAPREGYGVVFFDPQVAPPWLTVNQMQQVIHDEPTDPQIQALLNELKSLAVVDTANGSLWSRAFKDLSDIQSLRATIDTDKAEFKTATSKAEADYTTFRDQLASAIDATEVSGTLAAVPAQLQAVGKAAEGETPDKGNYASVDFGATVAYPLTQGTGELWVVPYIGLNLYFVPVDRTVALSQQVGAWFWQRFSLTIGATLTAPTLSGRTVQPSILGKYGVLAAGWRVTQYIRVTAGTLIYSVADANPGVAFTHVGAAPFLGGSLDADVIHLLSAAASP